MFIDHNAIGNIMKSINFNIISIDCVNCCLTNVLIYLFIYLLDIYYIFGHFNFVFNIFLYLRILKNDTV